MDFIESVPGRVLDLHSLYADPDLAFFTNADPNPDPNQRLKVSKFFLE
jgi:hypothetical protein